MKWLRRRPNLAAEEQRTGLTTTTWFVLSDLTWWCRIDGMSGHWVAGSEKAAVRILLNELRHLPTATNPGVES